MCRDDICLSINFNINFQQQILHTLTLHKVEQINYAAEDAWDLQHNIYSCCQGFAKKKKEDDSMFDKAVVHS